MRDCPSAGRLSVWKVTAVHAAHSIGWGPSEAILSGARKEGIAAVVLPSFCPEERRSLGLSAREQRTPKPIIPWEPRRCQDMDVQAQGCSWRRRARSLAGLGPRVVTGGHMNEAGLRGEAALSIDDVIIKSSYIVFYDTPVVTEASIPGTRLLFHVHEFLYSPVQRNRVRPIPHSTDAETEAQPHSGTCPEGLWPRWKLAETLMAHPPHCTCYKVLEPLPALSHLACFPPTPRPALGKVCGPLLTPPLKGDYRPPTKQQGYGKTLSSLLCPWAVKTHLAWGWLSPVIGKSFHCSSSPSILTKLSFSLSHWRKETAGESRDTEPC